ncbi:MAG TPA: SDR family oxidoreductase [Baekduia sp.]
MNVAGRVAVVTGGAGGIGAALARALADAGARVVVADRDGDGAEAVATSIGDRTRAVGLGADVSSTDALRTVIALAETAFGPVDVFCANAGIGGAQGLPDDDAAWDDAYQVNVMAHVRAARLLLPGWLERAEGGYFVTTASAAGLLTQVGAAPYSVTKHAAVAFAEWLAVTYGDRGVRVSCLCPMGVNTNMLNEGLDAADDATALGARVVAAAGPILEPEVVAERVLAALADETFLILPHPEVLELFRRKGNDYDRWLRGMRRLQAQTTTTPTPTSS